MTALASIVQNESYSMESVVPEEQLPSRRRARRRSSCSAIGDRAPYEAPRPTLDAKASITGGSDASLVRFEQSFSGVVDFNNSIKRDIPVVEMHPEKSAPSVDGSVATRRRQQRRSSWHASRPPPMEIPRDRSVRSHSNDGMLSSENSVRRSSKQEVLDKPTETAEAVRGTTNEQSSTERDVTNHAATLKSAAKDLNDACSAFQETHLSPMPTQPVRRGRASRRSSWHAGAAVEVMHQPEQQPPSPPANDERNRNRTILMVKHVRTGATRRRSLTDVTSDPIDRVAPHVPQHHQSTEDTNKEEQPHESITHESTNAEIVPPEPLCCQPPTPADPLRETGQSDRGPRTFMVGLREEAAPSRRRMNRRSSWGGMTSSNYSSSSDEEGEVKQRPTSYKKNKRSSITTGKKQANKKEERPLWGKLGRSSRSHSPVSHRVVVSTANMPLTDDEGECEGRAVRCVQLTAVGDVANCNFVDAIHSRKE